MTDTPDTPDTPDDHPISPDAVESAGGPMGLDLGALLGGGDEGGIDFGALLEQASQMQAQMAEAQDIAAQQVVEGVAGGGVVKVRVNGAMEFQSVTISPDAVDPADVEMLQDLVLAALNDAVDRIGEVQTEAMGGLDVGGMDLSGLMGDAG